MFGALCVRNRPQAERRAIQLAEELRQFGVDHLHDVGVRAEQLVARLVVELRVGPEVPEKIGQRALESDLVHDLLHLGAIARDFLQADRVDLSRRQRGGRVMACEVPVVRASVRRVPEADGAPGRGQVLVAEYGLETAIGGDHGLCDDPPRLGREPLAVGVRDGVGIAAEAVEEGTVFRRSGHLLRQRLQHALHDRPRLGAFLGGAAAQPFAVLVKVRGDRLHAADPGLVIGHRLERHQLGEFVRATAGRRSPRSSNTRCGTGSRPCASRTRGGTGRS